MGTYLRLMAGAVAAAVVGGSAPVLGSPVLHPPQPWVVAADGSDQRQLSEVSVHGRPSWSPAADRYVVGRQDGSVIVAVDGGESSVPWGLQAEWSPVAADTLVVVASPPGSEVGIYTYDVDTGEMAPVVTGVTPSYPVWSPDGNRIAFLIGSGGGSPAHLYVVDADGSNLEQVSATDALYTRPDWSPDSQRLAFTSWDYGVYVVDVDGSNERRLGAPTSPTSLSDPDWSPDGTEIATSGGWIFEVDGPGARTVTPGGQPDWSPDGESVAYSRDGRIHVVARDGSSSREVTFAPENDDGERYTDAHPVWSPDGSLIAFSRGRVAGWPPPGYLSIRYDKNASPESFRGGVSNARSRCVRGRVVTVKKSRRGRDRVVGQDKTGDAGKWRVPAPEAKGRFYAIATEKTYLAEDRAQTCPALQSVTIRI